MMKGLHIQTSHDFYITFDLPELNFGQLCREKKTKDIDQISCEKNPIYHCQQDYPTLYCIYRSFEQPSKTHGNTIHFNFH